MDALMTCTGTTFSLSVFTMTGVLFLVGGQLRAALEGLDQFAEWCEGRMGAATEEVMKLFWLKLPGKYEQRDACLKSAETRIYCL